MKDKPRLPPGQTLTGKFPVLHYGEIPAFDEAAWSFRMFGLVEKEISVSYGDFKNLPKTSIKSDFHCVTRWSKFDNLWEGVTSVEVAKLVKILPEAKYVMIHCDHGYTTNLSMKEFLDDDVIFAWGHNGAELTPEHGYPLRLVVPKLYAWKSAKWVRGVEFIESNARGFWESNGYHIHGDPWLEERFSSLE